MTLGDFIVSCSLLFDDWGGRGRLVDQAFCRAISRGIIRCYLVGDRVVGFARQFPDSTCRDHHGPPIQQNDVRPR